MLAVLDPSSFDLSSLPHWTGLALIAWAEWRLLPRVRRAEQLLDGVASVLRIQAPEPVPDVPAELAPALRVLTGGANGAAASSAASNSSRPGA